MTWLLANTDIKALVDSRIYPIILPQNPAYPAMTYEKISGAGHHNINFAFPRYQLSCFGKTYGAARGLADVVRWEMQRFKGLFGTVAIKQIVLAGEVELYDAAAAVYYVALDFKILHKEV